MLQKRGRYFVYLALTILLIISSSAYAQFCVNIQNGSLATGLVSHWAANGDATDRVGSFDGTIEGGVTFESGRLSSTGSSFKFDGDAATRVNMFHQAGLEPDEFTVMGWHRIDPLGTVTGRFVDKVEFNSSGSPIGGYRISAAGANLITAGFSDGVNLDTLESSSSLILGNWVHTTLTISQTEGAKLYFFGSDTHPAYAEDPTQTTYEKGIGNFTLGSGWGGSPEGGWIDDVIFWNRALNASEVDAAYGDALPICNLIVGDGVIDPGEECDDGNLVNGDGCSNTGVWEGSGCIDINIPGTYTLTQDINSSGSCLSVNADEATLNCAGNRIIGSGLGTAIDIGSSNVLVQNCIIENYENAITCDNHNITIRNIEAYNTTDVGISTTTDYENITIQNVTIGDFDNWPPIGIDILGGNHLSITDSLIYGDVGIDLGAIGFSFDTNNTIKNNHIRSIDRGIYLGSVDQSNISNNIVETFDTGGDGHGIVLENGADNIHVYNNTINGSTGRALAIVDQFFGTFYAQTNIGGWSGGWKNITSLSFGGAPTTKSRTIDVDNGTFTLRLAHDAHDVGAAHVDSVFLVIDGVEVAPTSAININENENILDKISSMDLDVADVLGDTIELTWSDVQGGQHELRMHAREESTQATRTPLYNPLESRNQNVYLSHTLAGGTVPIVDGYITAEDGYESTTSTIHWVPATGHPAADNLWYVSNDNTTLYIGFEFTSDNTDDYGVDWAAVYANVNGEKKEFRISLNETTYGQSSWSYTNSVNYQHKVFEFAIPLTELDTSSGETIEISFAAYGTGGGGTPSQNNLVEANTISTTGTGLLILNSGIHEFYDNTIDATGGTALEIAFADQLILGRNTFLGGGYDLFDATFDEIASEHVTYLPSLAHTCTSSNDFSRDLILDHGYVFANGSVSCWDQETELLFTNIHYDDPIILVDFEPDGTFEDCGIDCEILDYTDGILDVNILGFSAYQVFNNGTGFATALELWDEADPEGGSLTVTVGNETVFFANYTDINGSFIPSATLTITIPTVLTNQPMTFNATGNNLWTYNHTFASTGNYTWIVNATNTAGFNNATLNDTIEVFAAAGGPVDQPVPEFSTIALMALLVIALGGFVAMRKREE